MKWQRVPLPRTARFPLTVSAMPPRMDAPTTAIDRGANSGRKSIGGNASPGADVDVDPRKEVDDGTDVVPGTFPEAVIDASAVGSTVAAIGGPSTHHPADPALLEGAGNDDALDLGLSLPV